MSSSAVLSPHTSDLTQLPHSSAPRRNTRRSAAQRGTASPINNSASTSTSSSTRSRRRIARTSESGSNDAEPLPIDVDVDVRGSSMLEENKPDRSIKLTFGSSSPAKPFDVSPSQRSEILQPEPSFNGNGAKFGRRSDVVSTGMPSLSRHDANSADVDARANNRFRDRSHISNSSSPRVSPLKRKDRTENGDAGLHQDSLSELNHQNASTSNGLGLVLIDGNNDSRPGPSDTTTKLSPGSKDVTEEGEPEVEDMLMLEEDMAGEVEGGETPLPADGDVAVISVQPAMRDRSKSRRGGPSRKKRKGPVPGSLAIRRAAAAAAAVVDGVENGYAAPGIGDENGDDREDISDGMGLGRMPRKKRKWLKKGEGVFKRESIALATDNHFS